MSTDTQARTADTAVPLHPLLAERWSPRALDESHVVRPEQLTALLEAARWAPSANNSQPWRFVVAERGTSAHAAVLGTLVDRNRQWACAASALVLVAAEVAAADGTLRPWAVYDTGQAVAHLSVQAQHEGLAVHQLGGFDAAAATALLGTGRLQPIVVLAVGRRGDAAQLPDPLAARERAPRVRLDLDDLLVSPPDLVGASRAA